MGRPTINFDKMAARFPAGTFERIDAVLKATETRTDLIRDAVARELRRRESAKPKGPAPRDPSAL